MAARRDGTGSVRKTDPAGKLQVGVVKRNGNVAVAVHLVAELTPDACEACTVAAQRR